MTETKEKSLKDLANKSDAVVFLDSDEDIDFRDSIDDPIRDLNNNIVDVNNDVLEGDHRIDGGKLLFAEEQLTPQDESDLGNAFLSTPTPKKEPKKKEDVVHRVNRVVHPSTPTPEKTAPARGGK